MIRVLLSVTLRGLLNRRRTLLMLLLAASPVLIALLIRVVGRPVDPERLSADVLDGLVVRTVLPLVALIFGTGALGSELEDGTAVYLLVKPIERWRIIAAKLLAAAGLTAVLVVPAALAAGLLIAGDQGGGSDLAVAYAASTAAGALLYSGIFVALSVVTGRALVVGLIYTLIWEGLLAGLFAGTRVLSVREYVLAFASALDPAARIGTGIDLPTASAMTIVVLGAAFAIASNRLASYEVRSAE